MTAVPSHPQSLEPPSVNPCATPEHYEVDPVHDVYLQRYTVLSFLVILAFPLLAWLCGWLFERRRWKNSDYSGD